MNHMLLHSLDTLSHLTEAQTTPRSPNIKGQITMTTNNRTFPLFTQLPKELRDKVWKAAIRLPVPGVHIFTMDTTFDEKKTSEIGDHYAVVGVDHKNLEYSMLAAPRCGKSNPNARSWIELNPSTYLVDSGLLTACKESREAMDKHLQAVEWNTRVYQKSALADDLDAAVTASFIQDGERRFFRVKPRSDLFIIQPWDFSTFEWYFIAHDLLLIGSWQNAQIALEYDPTWANKLQMGDSNCFSEDAIRCISRAASSGVCRQDSLWLVDYRIHRRPGAPPFSGRSFRGVGCRYMEVDQDDANWDWNVGPDNVFHFINGIDCLYDDTDLYYREEQCDTRPCLVVLACEADAASVYGS